jgi:hypothetical protein
MTSSQRVAGGGRGGVSLDVERYAQPVNRTRSRNIMLDLCIPGVRPLLASRLGVLELEHMFE